MPPSKQNSTADVRHPRVTASGLPIGWTEPLSEDNPLRRRARFKITPEHQENATKAVKRRHFLNGAR